MSAVTFKIMAGWPFFQSSKFKWGLRGYILLIFLATSFLFLRLEWKSTGFMADRRDLLQKAAKELYVLEDDELLRQIYPRPSLLKRWTRFLREKKLSLFYEGSG